MTIYCENAAAAEVLFSLTGGREGRIVSYNPPVEIERAQGVVAVGRFVDNDYREIKVFKTFFARTIVNGPIGVGTWFSEEYSSYTYYQKFLRGQGLSNVSKRRFRCTETHRETNTEKVLFDIEYFDYELNKLQYAVANPIRAFKNAFIISDTTGILYAQDYQDIPVNYQVNCISCPPGLCAARGDGGKIACIDCPKVISGLNNASKRIDSIYG